MGQSDLVTEQHAVTETDQRYHAALDHLDRIIAAYDAPGIVPLVEAIKAAKAWRATVAYIRPEETWTTK